MGLRQVRAGDIRVSGKNFRTHNEAQRTAMRGLLADVGYVGALIARELPDGGVELLDGHMRLGEAADDDELPVLVVDISDEEAALVLATFDPIGDLAGLDLGKQRDLLATIETANEDLFGLLERLQADNTKALKALEPPAAVTTDPRLGAPAFKVIADCGDEHDQAELILRLEAEGDAVTH